MSDSLSRSFAPARAAEWRPGLADATVPHGEIFASSRDGAGAALALGLAQDRLAAMRSEVVDNRAWLWVQDAGAVKRTGRPYIHGLPVALRNRLIHVEAKTPEDALFALEEGLRCRDLVFVLGEMTGNPKALDFTASRRLSLAAERYGKPLWLVRLDARRDLSSARMRWNVQARPSLPSRWNTEAPGIPTWRAELFRARNHPPGEWILRDDGNRLVVEKGTTAPDHGDLAASTRDRPLASR